MAKKPSSPSSPIALPQILLAEVPG